MSGLQNQDRITNGGRASSSDGMTGFYNQVRSRQNRYQFMFLTFFLLSKISSIQDELRRFDANVTRIGDLHSRSLNNTDEALSQQNAAALDELVTETRALSNQIKSQIQDLEKESVPAGQDPRIRKNQAR
jgi:t-SNARE complex subunit (syntaxin)